MITITIEQAARIFVDSQFLIDNLQIERHMIDAFVAGHAHAEKEIEELRELRDMLVKNCNKIRRERNEARAELAKLSACASAADFAAEFVQRYPDREQGCTLFIEGAQFGYACAKSLAPDVKKV